jgi:hypothetical protein
MSKLRGGLSVQIPKPGEDQPRIVRVALIAVVGFAVGVIWPRLAGVRLAPTAPVESEAAVAPEPSGDAPAAGSGAPPASKAVPAASPAAAQPADRVQVSASKVTSCRDAKGAKRETCDAPDVDELSRPKILALAACPAAENLHGKLSLGIELDFDTGKVTDVQKGKSTSVSDASADALVACAKKEFSTLALGAVKHEHPKYTLFYQVELLAPGEAATAEADAGSDVNPASGRATVGWEVAIIREKPKDGVIVARLMRGTRVVVTGREGDWYRIKYDAKGAEGWVFRTAIGM